MEFVKVRHLPAHCHLNVAVEVVERAIPDMNSPPDHRVGVAELDSKLVDSESVGDFPDVCDTADFFHHEAGNTINDVECGAICSVELGSIEGSDEPLEFVHGKGYLTRFSVDGAKPLCKLGK